jgi:hypothetical protein
MTAPKKNIPTGDIRNPDEPLPPVYGVDETAGGKVGSTHDVEPPSPDRNAPDESSP